ncbi:2-hydroxy-6-oxononadienedioate/2-hydroxy-6-oxononatrienedioate hydrolase-like [Zingiber officinale]|uniref:AB hydrolase-1 domain-containing protein n=1 Tax=Zingiber officinale TaxID=94328 RepID=A0A8J5L875_ZINOF|nr:2-hydroxy-6-oxononadienedioate/2-hydroxy-6-oxononatrienedioate hydrolase-like [Zingiber officinale]KAG6508865.1 hypothetical protein ZIOFF_034247 [Zingiber officinale]
MEISLVWWIDLFVRLVYTSAGLRRHTVSIDAETTIRCWISSSLLPSSSAAGARSKKKPPLVLVHGFGPRGAWQWRSQIRPLAAHFDLVVPDLIFFGGSTTSSTRRSEAFQAASVVGLLDALGVAPPRRAKVSLMGTSYGGFVVYHMARMMGPERVDRVVIASSDLLNGPDDSRAFLERAGGLESVDQVLLPRTTADLKRLLQLAVFLPPRFVPEFLLRDVLRNLFSDKIAEKLELIKGISISHKDEFQLTPLPQQVLIIWGEHDQIFLVDKAFEMQKHLGENARLEVLGKTGHTPQAEDPKKFNKIILNFLLGGPKSSF